MAWHPAEQNLPVSRNTPICHPGLQRVLPALFGCLPLQTASPPAPTSPLATNGKLHHLPGNVEVIK
jgi:hypothetical protein